MKRSSKSGIRKWSMFSTGRGTLRRLRRRAVSSRIWSNTMSWSATGWSSSRSSAMHIPYENRKETELGRGIDRYRSYRLLYDSVGRRRAGFHGSGAAFPKGGPAAVSVGLCIVPPSVPVCRSRDSGSVPGRLRITSAPAPCRARRGIRWLSRSAGSRKSRCWRRRARGAGT